MSSSDWGVVSDGGKTQQKAKKTSSPKSSIFLRLEDNTEYRLRPIALPVPVWRYYRKLPDGKFRSAITSNAAPGDFDASECVINQKHGLEPSIRYAINVINRADGKLYIMEGPMSVFKPMKDWGDKADQKPGGANGADFRVYKDVPDKSDFKQTTYKVAVLEQTPLTPDEIKFFKEKGVHDLKKLCAPVEQDKIEQVLFPDKFGSETEATEAKTSVDSGDLEFLSIGASEEGQEASGDDLDF